MPLAQTAIREFLRVRTSYDVLPLSFRLIVLDTDLLIKKSLNILIQNGASTPTRETSPGGGGGAAGDEGFCVPCHAMLTVAQQLSRRRYGTRTPRGSRAC